MEPMVIFSAGLVIYCGILALADALRDMRRGAFKGKSGARGRSPVDSGKRRVIFSARRRGGAGGAHWPRPLAGSV